MVPKSISPKLPTASNPSSQFASGLKTLLEQPPPLEPPGPKINHNQPRQLTVAEEQARREKGLCYFCDD
ncbi:hypothetical protein J1N35_018443 [Gossypium stocksii]|uniref:Uncharacterized protein n=1 Tax=Gossypium stocksii TaxID=47602 RepID=A0A9D3VP23_9ROSI|nr:hypothetical protein J1N35_018443 [Gossypium stocksii]